MPLVLMLLGLMFLVVGVRGKVDELFSQIKEDGRGFLPYLAVIAVIGVAGYIKVIRPVTNTFLLLFIVVLIIGAARGAGIGTAAAKNFSDSYKGV